MEVRPLLLCLLFFHLNSVHSLPLLFLRFHEFIFGFCPPRHRHPPTAFLAAKAFNADISNWNTAAVTNMGQSTSTPPSCFCCCLFHLNSTHSRYFFLTISRFSLYVHPPTAFYSASKFNADVSKWNTAAVTTMDYSTSTPPSCFCCSFT